MKNFKTLDQLKKEFFRNKAFKKAYDELEPEFILIEKIIEARIKKGMTQAELARRIGTKQSALSRFERGDYNPSLKFLRKVADGLGVKLKISVS